MTEESPFRGITYRRKHTHREPTPIKKEEIPDSESEETPDKGKGVEETPEIEEPDTGDKEEQAFNNFLSAINDLARDQKEMVDLMRGMTKKGISTGKEPINGEGSNSAKGNRAHSAQSHSRSFSKTPRPNMPQFLHETPKDQTEQSGQGILYADYLEEYRALGREFQVVMSFNDFWHLKLKSKPKTFQKALRQNHKLQKALGKVTIPCFDGSSKCSARSWVQKLNTYFQLNQMTEEKAIKLATLHMDGEAHEWWYHGLVTMGHNSFSYIEFTQRLIERFDRKDLELRFRELAQLRQTSNPEAYISKFQRLAVKITDISKADLLMLIIEGLSEPLR